MELNKICKNVYTPLTAFGIKNKNDPVCKTSRRFLNLHSAF